MKNYFFVMAIIALLISCQDLSVDNNAISQNSKIQQAKDWLELNLDAAGRRMKIPMWNEAITYQMNGDLAIEAPLEYTTPLIASSSRKKETINKNATRLLMIKRNGSYEVFVMRVIPTEKNNAYLQVTGKSKPLTFNGDIIYSDWKENPKILVSYEGGKRINRSNFGPPPSARTEGFTCTSITISWYQTVCTPYGCTDSYLGSDTYSVCTQTQQDASLDPGIGDIGGSGGVGGDPNAPNEFVVDESIGNLCGNIEFNHVGASFTAQITGLGLSAINHYSNTVVNVEFGVSCVSIPEYYLSNSAAAAASFASAYNSARLEIQALLNSGGLIPSAPAIREKFKQIILENLNVSNPGSTLSTGPCAGNIPISRADYSC